MIGQYLTPDIEKIEGRSKIGAFDLDSTLITVNGTHKLSKDENDWKWWSKVVPKKLKQLYEEGYKIIIITNQGGLDISKKTSEKKRKEFMNKIKNIANSLNVPFDIYVATARDKHRKPMVGIWEYITQHGNDGIIIDMKESFYVGDAAGRDKNWKKGSSGDWADTDRKFAENIGIKFYTPEEFFENAKPVPYSYGDFNPKNIPHDVELFTPALPPLVPSDGHCEVVIFVGYPASGKSSFAKKWLIVNGYVHVNQDILKTKAKCIKSCEEALQKNKPVVIDNTNPDIESRKAYIDLAKQYKVPVRCFWFQASEALSKHNNIYRAYGTIDGPRPLPEVAYSGFKSRFIEPKLEEGFDEIKKINFNFEGNEDKRIKWEMWYT
ncbi:polynucleotide kinase 3 phosphatase-domain-containing protein [Glomus cerebriforme]|uniref:Polynucleotide kinase 3 phosphatase-domain-containing protein n=1 Tax=Glomus cerebriforme TaxID=658196 RepID=A0A397TRV7_9GLOM|nr:polynucleotide kinase 3 phosphatase-domain-containing protein [Glomus cerebriforme]